MGFPRRGSSPGDKENGPGSGNSAVRTIPRSLSRPWDNLKSPTAVEKPEAGSPACRPAPPSFSPGASADKLPHERFTPLLRTTFTDDEGFTTKGCGGGGGAAAAASQEQAGQVPPSYFKTTVPTGLEGLARGSRHSVREPSVYLQGESDEEGEAEDDMFGDTFADLRISRRSMSGKNMPVRDLLAAEAAEDTAAAEPDTESPFEITTRHSSVRNEASRHSSVRDAAARHSVRGKPVTGGIYSSDDDSGYSEEDDYETFTDFGVDAADDARRYGDGTSPPPSSGSSKSAGRGTASPSGSKGFSLWNDTPSPPRSRKSRVSFAPGTATGWGIRDLGIDERRAEETGGLGGGGRQLDFGDDDGFVDVAVGTEAYTSHAPAAASAEPPPTQPVYDEVQVPTTPSPLVRTPDKEPRPHAMLSPEASVPQSRVGTSPRPWPTPTNFGGVSAAEAPTTDLGVSLHGFLSCEKDRRMKTLSVQQRIEMANVGVKPLMPEPVAGATHTNGSDSDDSILQELQAKAATLAGVPLPQIVQVPHYPDKETTFANAPISMRLQTAATRPPTNESEKPLYPEMQKKLRHKNDGGSRHFKDLALARNDDNNDDEGDVFDAPEEMSYGPGIEPQLRDLQRASIKAGNELAITAFALSTSTQNGAPRPEKVSRVQGRLMLRTRLLRRWVTRYVSIVDHQYFGAVMFLFCHDATRDVRLKTGSVALRNSKMIVLADTSVREITTSRRRQHAAALFELRTTQRRYVFAAQNESKREHWLDNLTSCPT